MRSRPTTSVRGEYQCISMVSSPTNHKPPPLLYRASHYRVNGTIRTVSKPVCLWSPGYADIVLLLIWMTTWLVEDVVYHW